MTTKMVPRRANYLGIVENRLLSEWARNLWTMFPAGHRGVYLVGSCLTSAAYRDVDVRIILGGDDYDRLAACVVLRDLNTALSTWGQRATGLPLDVQVQRMTEANAEFDGRRHAIGLTPRRIT